MRRLLAVGFVIQSLAGAAWWLLLVVSPASRRWFLPPELPDLALLAFWLADLVLFVAGSGAAAWQLARGAPGARALVWLVTGAVCYAALFTIALSAWTGAAWLGAALMSTAAAFCLLASAVLRA